MHLYTRFLRFLTSIRFGQKYEWKRLKVPLSSLLQDEQGRWVSPGLIPGNFLTPEKTEMYRLQLAQQLEIDEQILNYSFASLAIIDPMIRQEKIKPLIYNFHLYLPLLSYLSHVVIRARKGELYLKRAKEYTDFPEEGYHNVRIPTLCVRFADKGEENISRLLGKEFSRMFHYTLQDTAQIFLEAGVNPNHIVTDYKTGKKW